MTLRRRNEVVFSAPLDERPRAWLVLPERERQFAHAFVGVDGVSICGEPRSARMKRYTDGFDRRCVACETGLARMEEERA